jgi:N-acetylornithine carbamoyltransferase
VTGLYHLGALAPDAVEALVHRAAELRQGAAPLRFEDRGLGLLFLAPSLRTQASMQRAGARLGLDVVQLDGAWQLETHDGVPMDGAAAEHVREAAGVLSEYVDVLAVRAFPGMQDLATDLSDPVLTGFRRFASVPVVNLESARWHPCQALADRATLEQLGVPKPAKLVLTWAWHPRPLPHAVPNSTVCMAAQRGMEVVVLHPERFELAEDVMEEARALAAASGGSVRISHDPAEALDDAAVVYAKSWGSLHTWGDPAADTDLRAPLRHWCVDEGWIGSSARLFHCLPVRRDVVVASDVLDGPRSAVLAQAANRLHAQTALLERLLSPSPTPTPRQETAASAR